ncbi:Nn.00g037360.m01.CDS01 [Neocucurbitaria sp. VM-36]
MFETIYIAERPPGDNGPLHIDVISAARFKWNVATFRLQFFIRPGTLCPWPQIEIGTEVGANGLSDCTIELARHWLDDCLTGRGKHVGCKAVSKLDPVLPARVIKIGRIIKLGPADSSGVSLYVPKAFETGRYVALSHCWGGQTPVMTTKSNLHNYLSNIPLPLPDTFMDAILVTKVLGIDYLWIDSLCIIQDSPEDWSIHAPQMASVYGNSYVTISADAANDSRTGFLEGSRRYMNEPKGVFFDYMGKQGMVWVRERGALAYQLPFHDWTPPINSNLTMIGSWNETVHVPEHICRGPKMVPTSPLSLRGWVFQERVLPPRTLHFGNAETAWECQSIISCECSALSHRYRRNTSLLKTASSSMPWMTVISQYSRLQFTVAEDRLMALSGLVEVRSYLSNDTYVFGMWISNMKREILWRCVRPGNRLNIAPSWSWASTDAEIRYPSGHKACDLRFGDWSILDAFPRLQGSAITKSCNVEISIEGPLLVVDILRAPGQFMGNAYGIVPKNRHQYIPKPNILNIDWDISDEEYGDDRICTRPGPYTFFIISDPPAAPEGLLLKPRSIASISSNIEPKGAYQEPRCVHFTRVAYVSGGAGCFEPAWSDCDSEDETTIEPKDKWDWSSWMPHNLRQTFTIT